MASPFSSVGAGAACDDCVSSIIPRREAYISSEPYLVAAVDRGVLSDAVDLVTGAGVDNVVR
jgi:hypothetical protein